MNLPRIPAHANLAVRTQISGHLPVWANAESASGVVASGTLMHLDFVLARAPEVEAAFQQRLRDQQNRTSPFYHQWLTPAQIGEMYGPNQADVDQITSWLKQQGYQVEDIAPSRTFVRVSAQAGVVAASLGTSFQMYTLANGKKYRAAVAEPSVPQAFSGVVMGVAGLSDTPDEPASHVQEVTVPAQDGLQPLLTSSSGSHYVAPGDFATIYNVSPLYAVNIDGTGQKIAIIGRSRVNSSDIANYESLVGLNTKQANVVIPPTGADPGLVGGGDQGEATLDVQRVIGTAPGARADLVISTNATGGIRTAVAYNVQTLLDPVMTISFGSCEASAGQAATNAFAQLFSQAAAEGISVFVSSGDSGAAGCDAHGGAAPSTTQIASINYICSSGFAVCVGGTQFNDTAAPANYWSTTSDPKTRASAKSYIPEGVWNEPTSTSTTTPFVINAGGGGASTYTKKPDFQTGNGVPMDDHRYTPDVSFTSSGHDAYFGCFTQTTSNCVVSQTGSFSFVGFSGTSAAAPSMAGIAALLNQKLGSAQGNLNPLIYRLAATTPSVFNDATVASSGVSGCTVSVPSICNNSTPTATSLTGGLDGYLLTAGYDLATGWGSFDVSKFISAAAGTGAATSVTLTGTSGYIGSTQQLNFTATVAAAGGGSPTGTVQFFANGSALGSAVAVSTSAGVTTAMYSAVASTLGPNGAYIITATYSGDNSFEASTSTSLNVTVTPGGTTASSITLTATPNPTTTAQAVTFSFTVSGGGSSAPTPTGTVIVSNYVGGSDSTVTTSSLSGGSGTARITFGSGTYVMRALYSGDSNYLPATSSTVSVVANPAQSATTLTGPASVANGGMATLVANVTGLSTFASTSSVFFYDSTTLVGTVPFSKAANATTGTASFTTAALLAGSHSFTATFAGDANVLASTSAALAVVVAPPPPGVTLSLSSPSVSFAAGASTGNTDVLTVTSVGGFAGLVNVGCTIVYNGTATQTSAPTCTLSSSTLTVAAAGTATTTVMIATTAARTASNVSPFERMKWTGSSVALAFLFGLPLGLVRRRRWQKGSVLVLLMLSAGLVMLVGCGGPSPTSTTVPGTATGAYTVTLSATSGTAVSAQTTFTLNVQ